MAGAGRTKGAVAVAVAVAATLLVLGTPAGAAAKVRIVSPAPEAFKLRSTVKVVVRAPRDGVFRASLGTREVTSDFARKGPLRVARLGGLAPGVQHLYATSGDEFDATRFIVARGRAASLALPPPRVGTAAAPAIAQVSRPRGARIRGRVNGELVGHAFHHHTGDTHRAALSAADGLRFGPNRLRVITYEDSGRYAVARERFHISRERPIASAGRDRQAQVGESVRLNGNASRLPSRTGRRSFEWRILESPGDGANTRAASGLRRESSARPSLRVREPGTYRVEVEVRRRGRPGRSRDTVVVNGVGDPPIGARIETVADASGGISIAGATVPGTGTSADRISYAVRDRATREAPKPSCSTMALSGTVSRDSAGLQALEKLAGDCGDSQYLLILNSVRGINAADVPEFQALLTQIGGAKLRGDERTTVSQGCPISVIGVPTAPAGSAFTELGRNRSFFGCSPGNLSGYLQRSAATNEYGFVFKDYPLFDTRAEGDANSNTMEIAGVPYSGIVDQEGNSAFHIVVLDPMTLAPRDEEEDLVFEFDAGTPLAAQEVDSMRAYLQQEVIGDHALVFMQSIGRIRPVAQNWDALAQVVAQLGGSRTVFNQLDGEYAFVGGPDIAPAEEFPAIATGGQVRLAGMLSRDRDSAFAATPISENQPDAVESLLPTVYGVSKPFPTLASENANSFFTRLVFPKSKDQPLDMRFHYWNDFGDEWGVNRDQIHDAEYARVGTQCGCTQTEFESVQTQLVAEIDLVRRIKNWVQNMREAVDPLQQVFNLQQISQRIQAAVQPPDAPASGDAGSMFVAILSIAGTVLTEPESQIASVAATAMGLFAGGQTAADGSELLGEIQAKTSDLGSQINTRFLTAKSALTGIGQIAVSDFGKMEALAASMRTINDTTPVSTTIGIGVKRFFYAELMSTAWARWELQGVGNARDWFCYGRDPYTETKPWSNTPDSSQYQAITGFNSSLTPNRVVRALGIRDIDAFRDHGARNGGARSPPATLTDPLFQRLRLAEPDHLGLSKEQFYELEFEARGPVGVEERC